MKKPDPSKLDGCGIYFSHQKFISVQKIEIPFNPNLESQLYEKPNCALVVVL
jgi:hypothetical protein